MKRTIIFGETLSTFNFYNDILSYFATVYKANKKTPPILDLRKTKYISVAAVPVLLAFGDYLSRLYKQPIELLIDKESELMNFVIFSRFKEIAKQLGVFELDEIELDHWKYKKLRDEHKISYTNIRYNDVDKIEDMSQRRNYINDCLIDRTRVIYETILRDNNQLPEDIIDITIASIAEIETNAIMYSKSHSFTYVASDRYRTNISIADSGIGFARSFKEEGREMKMVNKFSRIKPIFKNYLIIMSALNYSYEKHLEDQRKDLWTLKNNIVDRNGVFKIQYENTQVIFSCSRCKNCMKNIGKEDISACVECQLQNYSEDVYSPIKLFRVGFQGVRIEMTINKGE